MKVQINAIAWNFSRDTEFVPDTKQSRQFMTDHDITHTPRVSTTGNHQLEYHEDHSIVDISCETVQDIRDICTTYNAKIEIQDETALITFL